MSLSPAGLPLPQALLDLIESGFWPRTQQESNAQNLKSLIPLDKVQAFAPEEESIYFYCPPFSRVTVPDDKFGWLSAMMAIYEIEPSLTLMIGDFGLGSDAPIALDYRKDLNEPSVIRLHWGRPLLPKYANNHWIEIAPSFAEFARMLFD